VKNKKKWVVFHKQAHFDATQRREFNVFGLKHQQGCV